MKILLFEDSLIRVEKIKSLFPKSVSFVVTESVSEFIEYLTTSNFDYVFLDHDIEGKTDNGTQLVSEWTTAYRNKPFKQPITIIHSMNIPSGLRMKKILKNIQTDVHQIPFNQLTADRIKSLVK